MSDKIKTGNKGETLAFEFLQKKGFELVQRNFRFGKAEIDLIVKRADWVLFIEVKTRTSVDYGEPEDFVHTQQIGRIFDAAEEWIYTNDWHGNIRFDIVTVKMGDEVLIEHHEDAIN